MIQIHLVFLIENPLFQIRLLWDPVRMSNSAQAPPTIVSWQDRLTLNKPWVSCELSAIVSTPVQGKTRINKNDL